MAYTERTQLDGFFPDYCVIKQENGSMGLSGMEEALYAYSFLVVAKVCN